VGLDSQKLQERISRWIRDRPVLSIVVVLGSVAILVFLWVVDQIGRAEDATKLWKWLTRHAQRFGGAESRSSVGLDQPACEIAVSWIFWIASMHRRSAAIVFARMGYSAGLVLI
jgi:hypothetical protein